MSGGETHENKKSGSSFVRGRLMFMGFIRMGGGLFGL